MQKLHLKFRLQFKGLKCFQTNGCNHQEKGRTPPPPPDIPVKGFLHPAALIIFYIVQSTENLRGWNKSPFYEDKAFSSPSSLKAHRATV